MILVVSHPGDDHATAVIDAIRRHRYPVELLDTSRFPVDASLVQRFASTGTTFELDVGERRLSLGDCRAIWWRRPLPYTLHPGLAPDATSFAYNECHEAVAGMWPALKATWVNDPALDELAHHKPYQLAVAREVGLTVPETLITNDPDAVRDFVEHHEDKGVVYKMFLASEEHWRETRVMRTKEMEVLDRVRLAPAIFQEFVPAVEDLRVTVIGDDLYAAAITPAPGGYDVDYRMDLGGARFVPSEIPADVEKLLRALMLRLGLVYGAVDFRRTPDDRFLFLEVNPAGEWLFVEQRTAQPITKAMARLLIDIDSGSETAE